MHGTRFKQRMCGVASFSMCFFYVHPHFTTLVQTRRKPKHCEGADFRRRRRHRCLRFWILQINGHRSHLDSVRSQLLSDMSDTANAPRQVARARENMENTIEELHTRAWPAWHTELLRECTQANRVPLGQSAKDLNKLQRYLSHHSTVNGAKLEFHPNVKLRHVYKTIVFSDQSVSWHRLK